VFVAIPGYPNYEIDKTGVVRHIFKKAKPRVITPVLHNGTLYIRLTKDGARKEEWVHHLVAITFIGPAPPGKVLYHKNGNKQDNYVNNLVYITRAELGKLTGAKGRRQPVAKVNRAGEVVATYSSAREAAKANFMSYQTVMDRCNGQVKSAFALDGHRYLWDKDVNYEPGALVLVEETEYRMKRTKCPMCGEKVADNWWKRHMEKKHGPLPEQIAFGPFGWERATTSEDDVAKGRQR
jgi:hypothetical protein